MKKSILFISDVSEDDPLYQSQVKYQLDELKKYFDVFTIILDARASDDITHYEAQVLKYRSARGDYSFYVAKMNFWTQKKRLKVFLKNKHIDLIYSRGVRGGILGLLVSKLFGRETKIVNDVRADVIDENKDNALKKWALNNSNKALFKSAGLLFTVSSYLKGKIANDYGFDSNCIFVFPTFVRDKKFKFNADSRERIREELGYKVDDIVIIYSGNAAKYQNVDMIIDSFVESKNRDLKLLILSQDQRMKELLSSLENPNIKLTSVNHDVIQDYYHGADVGVLIRDNIDTNKCASPTKFTEYVNSGLYVIINQIESDYVSQFIRKSLQGKLMDRKNELRHVFDNLTKDDIVRNEIEINTLSEIVRAQSLILSE